MLCSVNINANYISERRYDEDLPDADHQRKQRRSEVEHLSGSANDNASGRPANHEEVLYFQPSQLITFLQQYEDSHSSFRMVCPWGGVPLPYVEWNMNPSAGLYIMVEFSFQMSEALLKFFS
jgi:hypothetical protein